MHLTASDAAGMDSSDCLHPVQLACRVGGGTPNKLGYQAGKLVGWPGMCLPVLLTITVQ